MISKDPERECREHYRFGGNSNSITWRKIGQDENGNVLLQVLDGIDQGWLRIDSGFAESRFLETSADLFLKEELADITSELISFQADRNMWPSRSGYTKASRPVVFLAPEAFGSGDRAAFCQFQINQNEWCVVDAPRPCVLEWRSSHPEDEYHLMELLEAYGEIPANWLPQGRYHDVYEGVRFVMTSFYLDFDGETLRESYYSAPYKVYLTDEYYGDRFLSIGNSMGPSITYERLCLMPCILVRKGSWLLNNRAF